MAIKVFYCNNTHTNLFFEVHIVTAKENKKRLAKPRHRIDFTPPPPPPPRPCVIYGPESLG